MKKLIFIIISFAYLQAGWALNLQTEDFGIRFPPNWSCDPDEYLFICTEQSTDREKSAIVLINFKDANPTENLADFRSRLNKPKSIKVTNGAPRLSRVVSFQDRVIGGTTWVEAIHFEGELPDYYTYYLATRKSKKFFLITLSAHKKSWDKYRPIFESTINSIRILTPEPTAVPVQPPIDFAGIPVPNEEAPKDQFGQLKEMTKGMSPARMFLFASIILGSLLVLYAARS